MYYQRRNPHPEDWWGEKAFCGLTRNQIALLGFAAAFVIGYFLVDWSWVFGRR